MKKLSLILTAILVILLMPVNVSKAAEIRDECFPLCNLEAYEKNRGFDTSSQYDDEQIRFNYLSFQLPHMVPVVKVDPNYVEEVSSDETVVEEESAAASITDPEVQVSIFPSIFPGSSATEVEEDISSELANYVPDDPRINISYEGSTSLPQSGTKENVFYSSLLLLLALYASCFILSKKLGASKIRSINERVLKMFR